MNDPENSQEELAVTPSSVTPEKAEAHPVPIIMGIGASAGRIESLEAFFSKMLANNGMTFVVIQHISP